MSGSSDWRASISAIERYENVQKLSAKMAAGIVTFSRSAFEVEIEHFNMAATRKVYEALFRPVNDNPVDDSAPTDTPVHDAPQPSASKSKPGIEIGPYPDCHVVGKGITSTVYNSRPRFRALKVITRRCGEPHNPAREAKVLSLLKKPCIPLLETFFDDEQRFVMVFPYMPLTLRAVLKRKTQLSDMFIRRVFIDIFNALKFIHSQGIIHRDIKPSAVLIAGMAGPAYLADFGIAWHPTLSATTEPADNKILDVGSGPYRAPEVLFGNKSYGPPVDMWAAGAMLAEVCRRPVSRTLFESPPWNEDGNQLGLILSMFQTIGSPTRESWPEAQSFRTPPFEMYRSFPARPWDQILPEIDREWREVVAACVKYNSSRATAEQVLQFNCLREK
ncbi:hypothetical protein OQA88_11098 [Cercophora sp. LCS_1]